MTHFRPHNLPHKRASLGPDAVKVEGGALSSVVTGTVAVSSVAGTVTTSQVENLAGLNIAAGRITGASVIHKNGHNGAVGTTLVPISHGGVYPMPQVAGATTLRIKAGGNANDTAAGTGAREVTVQVLDETGALVEETIATAGASASSATTVTAIRLLDVWVSASGTYGTVSSSSHAADITIEDSGGTEDWGVISFATHNYGDGKAQIGAYTVPLGFSAYISSIEVLTDSSKTTELHLYTRKSILDPAAPYEPIETLLGFEGLTALVDYEPKIPINSIPALTDIFFLAKLDSTPVSTVSVIFEIILEAE